MYHDVRNSCDTLTRCLGDVGAAQLVRVLDHTMLLLRPCQPSVAGPHCRCRDTPATPPGDWRLLPGDFAAILFWDFWRGEELGIRLRYAGREVHVAEVTPGSPAARAGLEAGDRITRLGAVQLRTRLDRFAFHPRLSFHEPVPIRWIRGSAQMQSSITVTTAQ